jgi:hypothetical protein
MFSIIIPRKSVGNRGESLPAYDSKQIYFIYKYTHKDTPISYKEFFENFPKYIKLTEFNWQHTHKKGKEKGQTCYPNPKTAKDWPAKYDWDNDYKTYENFMNGTAQEDVFDRYLKSLRDSGKSLVEIKTNLEQALLQGSQLPFFELMKSIYPLAKMGELLSLIDDLIQKDINFRNEEEVTAAEIIPVSNNPDHELDEINDYWDSLMWKEIGEDNPW